MMSIQDQTVRNLQDQKLEIKEILEKLRQRDSELFVRIIDTIHNQDDYASRILAHEIAEIRKAIVIIENASAGIPSTVSPELLLCPSCCSAEICISHNNTSSKCHCLDCGKTWIVGMDGDIAMGVQSVWSLA